MLTAALPKREPVGLLKGRFKESGLSFEVSIGDSLGRGLGTTVRPGLVGVAISGLCVLTAAVIALVVALKRISAKRRFPPPQYQPAS